jgi:hypothetical protein
MKTTDIGLASSLVSAGHRIENILSDGAKGTFYFEDSEQLAKDVAAYWEGDLMVPARKMFESIKIIKGRVRSL